MTKKKNFTKVFLLCALLISMGNMQSYAEVPEKKDAVDWNKWVESIDGYIDKVKIIEAKASQVAEAAEKAFIVARRKDDKALGDEIMRRMRNDMDVIIKALKTLSVPEEFVEYNEKLIASYVYRQNFCDAMLIKDMKVVAYYKRKGLEADLDILEENKKLQIKHGAPKQVIDGLDMNISQYKKLLNK